MAGAASVFAGALGTLAASDEAGGAAAGFSLWVEGAAGLESPHPQRRPAVPAISPNSTIMAFMVLPILGRLKPVGKCFVVSIIRPCQRLAWGDIKMGRNYAEQCSEGALASSSTGWDKIWGEYLLESAVPRRCSMEGGILSTCRVQPD